MTSTYPYDTPDLGTLGNLLTVRAEGLHQWRSRRSARDHASCKPQSTARTAEPCSGTLSEAEARFLRAIVNHPALSSSQYPRLAGVSLRRGLRIREDLAARGYIRTHQVNRAGRGRDARVLEITDAGRAALARFGSGEGLP